MKIKEVTREVIKYLCPKCEVEYDTLREAESCIREHQELECKHPKSKVTYDRYISNLSKELTVVKSCYKCNLELAEYIIDTSYSADKFLFEAIEKASKRKFITKLN